MKIKFNRSAMAEALGLVNVVVPSRTTKPILQSVKLAASDDGLLISATDFETGITTAVAQSQIEKTGDAVIPADKFAAIVRECIDEILELESDDGTCHIRGADSVFTIYGHQPEQYPQVPMFDGTPQMVADLNRLQEGIEHCLFATAKENTRYALSGILLEPEGKKLTMVGTDGRRLAKYKLSLHSEADKAVAAEKIIVPAKTMSLLDRISGDQKAEVAVRIADNKIVLACGSTVISSNLVDGNFPKYEDIIPTDYKNKLTLNTAAALSAVRRAALLCNEDSKGVKLAVDGSSLIFTSRAPEMGDAEIAMEVEYQGQTMEIGFNPQFLIDVLKIIGQDSFEMHLGAADRPGLIKCGSNYVYIVMPVSLT